MYRVRFSETMLDISREEGKQRQSREINLIKVMFSSLYLDYKEQGAVERL